MESKYATGVQKIQKVQPQNQKNAFLAVLVPNQVKVVLNAVIVTPVKRVLVSMVLVICVWKVNTEPVAWQLLHVPPVWQDFIKICWAKPSVFLAFLGCTTTK